MTTISYSCPYCGHTADVEGEIASHVLRCDECETIVAYGVPMPRVAIQVHPEDARFVAIRIESSDASRPAKLQIAVDRTLGLAIADKLRSVCSVPDEAPGLAPVVDAATCNAPT